LKEIRPVIAISATKQIAEQIRDAIIAGEFQKGDRLPTETELATSFGVSRGTVREALKRLAAQNLIRSRRGPTGGTFISNFQIADASANIVSSTILMLSLGSMNIPDIIEVRRFMELECCHLAMRNWDEDVTAKMQQALDALEDPGLSDQQFCDADVNFHRTIVNASGNKMLEYLMYGVIESLVPVMNMIIVYVRDRSDIISFYKNLNSALLAADESRVVQILNDLMIYLNGKIAEAQALQQKRLPDTTK
jgi:GntR family transcriptional repressor for pyruvate dehydrogenase complex